jgi:hypothetical protein
MPYTTIDRPSNNFRIKLYTGNGSTQSITFDESTAMQPDCTWIKVRNDTNVLLVHDVIRGATKEIYTSLTNAEVTAVNGLTAFNSNGFSVGSDNGVNRNGYNLVNWSWKANGAGVSNTAGSITSTVSANTTSGFSIVSWTGTTGVATVGHGLGVKPDIIIIKNRSVVSSWVVYHKSLGATKYLFLNLTSAQQTDSLAWNNTEPDSTKFTINSYTNGSGNNLIAYCFAEIKGFSKFGSYTGNGSTDGTFVYTGFKPAFVMCKSSSNAFAWVIHDSKRSSFNPTNKYVYANATNAEASDINHDFLSNGFKIRETYSDTNGSGMTYIYMAFAENPFVSSKGIPCTAR